MTGLDHLIKLDAIAGIWPSANRQVSCANGPVAHEQHVAWARVSTAQLDYTHKTHVHTTSLSVLYRASYRSTIDWIEYCWQMIRRACAPQR